MRNQSGFTLIELVLVIIILGILAAVAVPRFINLSSEAQTAALQGTVGAIESASSINFAASKVGDPSAIPIPHGTSCSLTTIDSILQQPLTTGKYGITAASPASTANTLNCVVTLTAYPAQAKTAILLFTN